MNALVKKPESETHCLEFWERAQDAHIQFAVGDVSVRRDITIVAILRRVGNGNHHRLCFEFVPINFQPVFPGTVADKFPGNNQDISQQAPFSARSENMTDAGIESGPEGAEEWPTVDQTVIDADHGSGVDQLQRVVQFQGDMQVPRQPVTRSARHNTHSRRRIAHGHGYFVHGAIATHRHDVRYAFVDLPAGQFGGMSRLFRKKDADIKT